PGDAVLILDASNDAAWNGAAHGDAVQHAGQRQVIDITCESGDLRDALPARDGAADGGLRGHRKDYLSFAPRSRPLEPRSRYWHECQPIGSPVCKPRRTHVTRGSERPCVNLSGITCPPPRRWSVSSPIAAAARNPSSRSPSSRSTRPPGRAAARPHTPA